MPDPKFSSQTKDKLVSSEVRPVVEGVVNEALQSWFEEHPSEAKIIVGKVVEAAAAREAARKARELTAARARSTSPRCPASSPTARSAIRRSRNCSSSRATRPAARAKQGRNREFQAVLPLRGKILNVERARFDKMLSSEQIGTLITALGTGIGRDEFTADKLRYHKIIIMTDADVDGSHIRTLLLTFFYRQMRELIDRGHLFIAQPPLYKVTRGKSEQYLKDERALEDYLIDTGLEDAVLRLATGEERAGDDLRRLVEEARAIRSVLQRPAQPLQSPGRRAGRDRRRAALRDLRRSGEGRRRRALHRPAARCARGRDRARLAGHASPRARAFSSSVPCAA